MAERIVSPGVFTRERDLSFLPQAIGAIGAAISAMAPRTERVVILSVLLFFVIYSQFGLCVIFRHFTNQEKFKGC